MKLRFGTFNLFQFVEPHYSWYTRKDTFDRAVGNNSVCKSCAQMDRKLTLETIEKMKQPKTIEHKKKISRSIEQWWEERKQQEINYGFNRQQTIK